MALKADRDVKKTDVSFFMTATAERGGIVSTLNPGSGVAMDQGEAAVQYKANPSGALVLGLLLQDVVNKDLTQTPQNFFKDEAQVNTKVCILKDGWVVTDQVLTGHSPSAGTPAYVAHSGKIATTDVATDHVNAATYAGRKVGHFLSQKDQNGFAKVMITL